MTPPLPVGQQLARGDHPNPIDVLWLVEHVAREFDVACAVKAVAEREYGIRVEVRNIYEHIRDYLARFDPAVVVHPFVYFVRGALATEDVFERWPDAIHVNAAWEQIHYKAHLKVKAPADDLARERVIHHAWGDFYRDYLIEHGVRAENIVVSGHPAYQLYKEPYRGYFQNRASLAQRYGLDVDRKWIFVPENYRWAFAQRKIDFFVSLGADRKELNQLVNFSIPSLTSLLKACLKAADAENVEIIFRPRPAVSTDKILAFLTENVGTNSGGVRFIKEGSVREWILASDVVVSSYSTSLVEAAVAGKSAWMYEPIPIPASLHCEWYDYAPKLHSITDFLKVCREDSVTGSSNGLATWAADNLLPPYDPIKRFSSHLKEYCMQAKPRRRMGLLPRDLEVKEYFSRDSHEMDSFTAEDVSTTTLRWKGQLYGTKEMIATMGLNHAEIINKSMNRDDLLTADAQQLIAELNELIRSVYASGASPSSWVGTLPKSKLEKSERPRGWLRKFFGPRANNKTYMIDASEAAALERGYIQRLDYTPLPHAEDDLRYPWFLYWEIYWVLRYMRPRLHSGMRLLDAGGASSLFTCYMASKGYELHSVDLNERLLANGDAVAKRMGWCGMHSYCMDMRKIDFPDEYFDHAFSICVFEHLDYDVKQAALAEIARCLKPGGILSLTFDYRNPAPGVVGIGKDPSPRNALKTEDDIRRSFLGTGHFKLVGNTTFDDNGKSYLRHPTYGDTPYTFGAVFLQKV